MTINKKLAAEMRSLETIVEVLRPLLERTRARLLRWAQERLEELADLASEEEDESEE